MANGESFQTTARPNVECSIQIIRAPDLEDLDIDCKHLRCCPRGDQLGGTGRGIPYEAHAANARSSLLKQLEPLPGQAGKIKEQPGKISARPAKTAHESALNRIGFQIECHNRDRSGGVPRGPNRWGTDRIDNVGVKADDFRSEDR